MYPQKIKDFTKSHYFLHSKLKFPDRPIEECALSTMKYIDESYKKELEECLFFKDYVKNSIKLEDKGTYIVDKRVKLEGKDKYMVDRGNWCMDGIYDIWLRNMKNVRSIKLVSENCGVMFETTLDKDTDEFQIPLAFHTENEPPRHCYMYSNQTSVIPLFLILNDALTIEINEDAEADVHLSTLLTPKHLRFNYSTRNIQFFVNGKSFYADPYERKCIRELPPKKKCFGFF
jgi:hypothetical protein